MGVGCPGRGLCGVGGSRNDLHPPVPDCGATARQAPPVQGAALDGLTLHSHVHGIDPGATSRLAAVLSSLAPILCGDIAGPSGSAAVRDVAGRVVAPAANVVAVYLRTPSSARRSFPHGANTPCIGKAGAAGAAPAAVDPNRIHPWQQWGSCRLRKRPRNLAR